MKKTIKKRAFISAIAMLIVSAIVLTSSTFAWFSMSKATEVESMNLNITTADGISISANVHKFGTSVTTDDIIPSAETAGKNLAADSDHKNNIPNLLAPASSDMVLTDGYPTFYKGSIGEDKKITVEKIADETIGCFVVFDLFVQLSQNNTTVKLAGSTITSDDGNIVKAMRLGLVNCGYKDFAERENGLKTLTTTEKSKTALWIVDGSGEQTRYISHNAGDKQVLSPTDENNPVITSAYTATITTDTVGTVATAANASDLSFIGQKGVNRVRFYLWVEGNDPDCTNDIAGGNFDFNLKLSID